jgi:ureidoglycolate dehydrogenase (NAD+)
VSKTNANASEDIELSGADRVRDFLVRALVAASSAPEPASAVAEVLTEASLRGVDSHGIRLLLHYTHVVQTGRINPRPMLSFHRTGPATGSVDGDNGFGHYASFYAIDQAMSLAAETGVAAVSVIHSSHFGAAGCYVLRAALKNFIALCTCNSDSFVLPHDGIRPFHGTNPFAFAAPVAGERPYLVDMATSAIPWNRVQDLKMRDLPMPPEVSVDEEGDPTLDPSASAALLPLGGLLYGYKGAALASMAEVLSAVLTGMPHCSRLLGMAGPDFSTPRHLGHFFIVIDPQRFVSPERFRLAMATYLQDLRSQPARPNTRVMAPGDREWAIEAERARLGIPISAPLAEAFDVLADQLGIARFDRGIGPT